MTDGVEVLLSPPCAPGQTGPMIESCHGYLQKGENIGRAQGSFPKATWYTPAKMGSIDQQEGDLSLSLT